MIAYFLIIPYVHRSPTPPGLNELPSELASDKVASESVRLVEAFNNLKNNHTEELPRNIAKATKHIDYLTAVCARPTP